MVCKYCYKGETNYKHCVAKCFSDWYAYKVVIDAQRSSEETK